MYYHYPAQGFILVTTIWFLAILTIAASFLALWTQRSLTLAQSLQDDVQGEIDMYSTKSNLLYVLSTQRFTIGGMTVPLVADPAKTEKSLRDKFVKKALADYSNDPAKGTEIALDDRPYVGTGKAYFALQELGGLININLESEAVIGRLLGLLGVAEDLQAPLVAKLKDYIDLDDLHRLNGAESFHYRQRNLPPPTNHFLSNPMECKRILGWAEQPWLWKDLALAQLTNTILPVRPNFNTAPVKVLQAAYYLDAETAERFVKLRQTLPFYNVETIFQVTGAVMDLENIDANLFPSPFFRLTLWYQGNQRMQQIFLNSNPKGDDAKPWLISYRLISPLLPIYTQTEPNHVQTTLFDSSLSTKTP